jgi:hypothetical protein
MNGVYTIISANQVHKLSLKTVLLRVWVAAPGLVCAQCHGYGYIIFSFEKILSAGEGHENYICLMMIHMAGDFHVI